MEEIFSFWKYWVFSFLTSSDFYFGFVFKRISLLTWLKGIFVAKAVILTEKRSQKREKIEIRKEKEKRDKRIRETKLEWKERKKKRKEKETENENKRNEIKK